MKQKSKPKKISKAKLDKIFAIQIKDAVQYICQVCRKRSKFANAHHILPKRGYPELRFDVKNLICLCPACHKFAKTSAHNNGVWFTLWLAKNKRETLVYLKPFLKRSNILIEL